MQALKIVVICVVGKEEFYTYVYRHTSCMWSKAQMLSSVSNDGERPPCKQKICNETKEKKFFL